MEPEVADRSRPQRLAVAAGVLLICAFIGLRLSQGWRPDEPKAAEPLRLKLDPNTATAEELAALPRMGPSIAQRILARRQQMQAQGIPRPYQELQSLDEVEGIGPALLRELEPYLRFDVQ